MSEAEKSDADQTLLETLLEGTAAETGEQFLAALVRSLAKALRVDGAWVTEYLPGPKRLRALSFWLHDHYVPDYEYDIAGTPCEASLENRTYMHIAENVVELFPVLKTREKQQGGMQSVTWESPFSTTRAACWGTLRFSTRSRCRAILS